MNDEDRSNLRDLHAGFAMIGLIMRGEDNVATKAYLYADEMQDARDLPTQAGIVSVKRRTKKEKADE